MPSSGPLQTPIHMKQKSKNQQMTKSKSAAEIQLFSFDVVVTLGNHEFKHKFTPLEYESYAKKEKSSEEWKEKFYLWGTDAFLEFHCATEADRYLIAKTIDDEQLKS